MKGNDPRWSAAAWALFAIGLVGLALLVCGLLITAGVGP